MTSLKHEDINLIRDAALKLEKLDIIKAHDLMALAHRLRPEGPSIHQKLLGYKKLLEPINAVRELVNSGELAIIPIGFRCYTAGMIEDVLGIKQSSLPFNSGFFTPDSVASVLDNPEINMSLSGEGVDHSICMKTENHHDSKHGLGIKFDKSSYEEINEIVQNRNVPKINKYLDSTFGYYTLNKQHSFLLAHYNWHILSDESKSAGVTDPSVNLIKINAMFERRISRMMDLIHNAKHVIFCFGNNQGYRYLQLDNKFYFLDDFSTLEVVCKKMLKSNYSIINNINDGNFTASKILDLVN